MDWTRKKRIFAFLMIGALSFIVGNCGLIDDDDDDKKGDPVPEATGNIVLTTASEVALGVMNALLSTSGGVPKPSNASLTAQTALVDKGCGGGGLVDFEPDNPTGPYTATITDCADENVVINGTVTGTIGPVDGVCDLPTSMTGTINDGSVVVTGVDGIEFTFTNFGVNATNITYGPDCDLDGPGASITASLTGKIKGDLDFDIPGVGTSFSIDFGNSLNVNVTSIIDTNFIKGDGFGREVTMDIDGTVTIDSPCKSGSFTISATDLMTVQPNACPVSGSASYTSVDFGSVPSIVFNGSCDFVACELSAGDLLPFSE